MANARPGVSPSQQVPSGRGTVSPTARPDESNVELERTDEGRRGAVDQQARLVVGPEPSAWDSAPAPARPLPALPARPRSGCSTPPGSLGDPWAAARAAMTDYGEEQHRRLEGSGVHLP